MYISRVETIGEKLIFSLDHMTSGFNVPQFIAKLPTAQKVAV
jgi:hypothetical protein